MGEYEELLAEKKRIEQRLKEIRNSSVIIGRARLERRKFYGHNGGWSYNISVKKHSGIIESESKKWYSIVEDYDKDKAIAIVSETITDLQKLLDDIKDRDIPNGVD